MSIGVLWLSLGIQVQQWLFHDFVIFLLCLIFLYFSMTWWLIVLDVEISWNAKDLLSVTSVSTTSFGVVGLAEYEVGDFAAYISAYWTIIHASFTAGQSPSKQTIWRYNNCSSSFHRYAMLLADRIQALYNFRKMSK